VAAGALRLGNTVEAAITSRRLLGPAEARTMALGAMMLLTLAVVAALWPQLVAFPVAALSAWVGLALLVGARRALRRRGAGEALERRPVEEKGPLDTP
jgi:cardiolipin synthase